LEKEKVFLKGKYKEGSKPNSPEYHGVTHPNKFGKGGRILQDHLATRKGPGRMLGGKMTFG